MKKQTVFLAISAAVVVLLSVLLAVLLMQPASPEDTDSETSDSSLTVLDLEQADLSAITIQNSTGTFSLTNHGDAFSLDALDGLETSSANTQKVVDALCPLTASQLIWAPEEDAVPGQSADPSLLAQYGLDAPAATVTFQTVDQQSYTLQVGADAPLQSGTYFMLDDCIYLGSATSFSVFQNSQNSFVDNQITSAVPSGYTQATLELSGASREQPMVIEITSQFQDASSEESQEDTTVGSSDSTLTYTYTMTQPQQRTLSEDAVTSMLDGSAYLYADAIVAVNPSSEQLASYGLSDPWSVFSANFNGDTLTLRASAPDAAGAVYLMRDGTPIVYQVTASRLPWYEISAEMLIQAVYTPVDFAELSSLTVTADDQTYRFTVVPDSDTPSVLCNGQEVDPDQFTLLYETITQVPPDSYYPAEPTLDPALTMTVEYTDSGRAADTIVLTPTGSGTLFLTVNGQTSYTTAESRLDTILEACQALLDGETIPSFQ